MPKPSLQLFSKLLDGKTKRELIEEGYSESDVDKHEKVIENNRKKQFESNASEALSWVIEAARLKRAADKLFDIYHAAGIRNRNRAIEAFQEGRNRTGKLRGEELEDFLDGEMISVYFLLMGFAVENLLKGILLTKDQGILKQKGSLNLNKIKTHNLVSLSHKCGLKIENKEKSLLDKLEKYIIWQGKYPVPLSVAHWNKRGEPFRGRKTQEELNHLYDLLLNELEAILSRL